MIKLARIYEAVVLLAAGYASLATTQRVEDARIDERWVIMNLFDGQTAVPRDVEIDLRIGVEDFRPANGEGSSSKARSRAERAFEELSLREVTSGEEVRLGYDIGEETTRVWPIEPLREDTRYELDAAVLADTTVSRRVIPGVIAFTTRPGPQVTGIWLVNDTLMITFSEPIEPGVLELSPESVDLLWESQGSLYSATADRNLADFVWDDDGLLFRVAPVSEFDELWVKVSGAVYGESGAPLDGDGDGEPGEIGDDFLELVTVSSLPRCLSSEDRPEPCVPQTW